MFFTNIFAIAKNLAKTAFARSYGAQVEFIDQARVENPGTLLNTKCWVT